MATLILTVVGSYYGGPIGAAIGNYLGQQIDAMIFGVPKVEGPRLSDLKVSSSTYGIALPLTYGEQNRVVGNLIWAEDIRETKHKESNKQSEAVYYTYSCTFAMSFGLGPISRVKRIWANGKLIFDPVEDPTYTTPIYYGDTPIAGWKPRKRAVRAVRCYLGTPAQPVDSSYQTLVGVADACAYRGEIVIVFEAMQLANYGNAIPTITAEIDAGPADVASVAGDLCERVGLTTYDVTGFTTPVPGFTLTDNASAADAIGVLMAAHKGIAFSEPGGVAFKPRLATPKFGIDFDAAGADENEAGSDDAIKVTRVPDSDLPSEVEVTFLDPERDYQVNTQRSPKREDGNAQSVVKMNLPLVMSADQGKQLADSMLYQAHQMRRTVDRVAFPPGYSAFSPATILDGMVLGQPTRTRATRVHRGANGLAYLDLVYDDINQLISPNTGTSGNIPAQETADAVPTTFYGLDIPILRSADDDTGWYGAVSAASDLWVGCEVFRSADNVTYTSLGSEGTRATVGTCSTTLGTGPQNLWDDGGTVTVVLLDPEMTLASISDAEVFAGGNVALVGSEIIQFGIATLTAPGTYALSRLLRGRYGTEAQIAGHGASERFILINESGGIRRVSDEPTLLNQLRYYKAVSLDQDVDAVAGSAFVNTGVGKRPYAPCAVVGTRNSTNDLRVTWSPRTRLPSTWVNPVAGDPGNFIVEVMSGASVVRTIEVTGGTTAYYSAAQQTADFGSVQTSYTVRVAQVSAYVGAGLRATATVPQWQGASFTVP